jgi:hypothetical protein
LMRASHPQSPPCLHGGAVPRSFNLVLLHSHPSIIPAHDEQCTAENEHHPAKIFRRK